MKPASKHADAQKKPQYWQKLKQKRKQENQQLLQQRPVYNKRQKSRRHKKVRPYSEPDVADVGWSPATAPVGGDLAPGDKEDRFLPRSLREFMWLKKVAELSPKERRRYLKSRRRTNPEAGDVAGMRRAPAKQANLRRRPGESQMRHLARVEQAAQRTLLTSQYADRFGQAQTQSKSKQQKQGKPSGTKQKQHPDPSDSQKKSDNHHHHQQQQQSDSSQPQRRRSRGTSRPSRLEPVASEPPKSLARLKLPFKVKDKRLPTNLGGGSSVSGGGLGGYNLDRALLT